MTYIVILLTLIVSAGSMPALAQSSSSGANAEPKGDVERGKKMYITHGCWACHGYQAQGGAMNPNATGPRLHGSLAPWPAFSKYIRQPTRNMIPYTEKVLPEQNLADIYAWIKSLPPPPPMSSLPILKD